MQHRQYVSDTHPMPPHLRSHLLGQHERRHVFGYNQWSQKSKCGGTQSTDILNRMVDDLLKDL